MRRQPRSVTFFHGVMDYLTGVLLLAAPWLFGFNDHRIATLTTAAFGLVLLLYSMATDYELGLAKLLPMSAHLALDGVSAGLLIAAPFLFNFSDRVWVPHLVVGIVEAAVTGATVVALGILALAGPRRRSRRRAAH